MSDLPAYRRVRRDDLISRWWPLQALTRMTLPLPVTPIRFWAALWLFILGTVAYSPDVTGSGAGVLSVVFFAAATGVGAGLAASTGAAGVCSGAAAFGAGAGAAVSVVVGVGSAVSAVASIVAGVASGDVAA